MTDVTLDTDIFSLIVYELMFFFRSWVVADLKAVGQSYGFVVPPHIDIGVAPSKKARPRKMNQDQRFSKTKIYRQPNAKGKMNFGR